MGKTKTEQENQIGFLAGLVQAVQAQEKEKSEGKSTKNQEIFLAGGEAIHPKSVVQIILKARRRTACANITKLSFFHATHRTPPFLWQIVKEGIG